MFTEIITFNKKIIIIISFSTHRKFKFRFVQASFEQKARLE